jgi:hypothetical protein
LITIENTSAVEKLPDKIYQLKNTQHVNENDCKHISSFYRKLKLTTLNRVGMTVSSCVTSLRRSAAMWRTSIACATTPIRCALKTFEKVCKRDVMSDKSHVCRHFPRPFKIAGDACLLQGYKQLKRWVSRH